MVDVMKGIKWIFKGKNKEPAPLNSEELRESLFLGKANPKRGEIINATQYPLPPVGPPKKIKRLPPHLRKCSYRKGRVN